MGFCDVEIHLDYIAVTTKLSRQNALGNTFAKVSGYEFEAFGVEDYLSDYYHKGMSIQEMKKNILLSF